MNMPSLPTDNLYKFLALGGLVTLVVFPIFYVSQVADRNRQMVETETEALILEKEVEFLKWETNALIDELAETKKDAKMLAKESKTSKSSSVGQANDPISPSVDSITKRANQILLENKGYLDRGYELRRKTLELEKESLKLAGKRVEINLLDGRLNAIRRLTLIGISVSSVIMILGFSLWYLKLQKYQDQTIARQATAHDIKGDSNT